MKGESRKRGLSPPPPSLYGAFNCVQIEDKCRRVLKYPAFLLKLGTFSQILNVVQNNNVFETSKLNFPETVKLDIIIREFQLY